jgi:hypothetical protein
MTDEERRKDSIKRMVWEMAMYDYQINKVRIAFNHVLDDAIADYHKLAVAFYDYDFEKEKE